MADYQLGSSVRVSAVFVTNGAAVDPTTVNAEVTDPSGDVTTLTYAGGTITKGSTGNYSLTINANEAGTWKVRCWSTGTGQAAEVTSFHVRSGG